MLLVVMGRMILKTRNPNVNDAAKLPAAIQNQKCQRNFLLLVILLPKKRRLKTCAKSRHAQHNNKEGSARFKDL